LDLNLKNSNNFAAIWNKLQYEADCHDHDMQILHQTMIRCHILCPASPSVKSKVSGLPLCKFGTLYPR